MIVDYTVGLVEKTLSHCGCIISPTVPMPPPKWPYLCHRRALRALCGSSYSSVTGTGDVATWPPYKRVENGMQKN